eukprot:COSAG06_NODE_17798_length_920_cov_16.448234_1_plen_209_part_00
MRPGCSLAAAAAAAAIVAGMAGASPAGQLPGRFPSLEPIAGAVSGYLKTQGGVGGVGGVAKSQGQCDNVIMLLGTALRLAEFVTRPTRMAAHRTSSSACASMPVLHEAALICKLAWPSWSVCNYLPTCLLVLLTCAVPRCMMLTLPSSDQRSPIPVPKIIDWPDTFSHMKPRPAPASASVPYCPTNAMTAMLLMNVRLAMLPVATGAH